MPAAPGSRTLEGKTGRITRNKILEVAETLLSDRCFEKVSIREIADKAQINTALIYYYFANKSDLRDAIFDHLFERLFVGIQEELDRASSAWDKIRGVIHQFVTNISQYQRLHRIVLHGVVASENCRPERVDRYMQKLHDILTEVIEEGIEQREIEPLDPGVTAQLILGSLIHLTTSQTLPEPLHRIPLGAEEQDRLMRTAEKLFNRGLAERGKR